MNINQMPIEGEDISLFFEKKRYRDRLIITGLALLLFTVMTVGIWMGVTDIPVLTVVKILFHHIFNIPDAANPAQQAIIVKVRAPRVVMAALVGAGLATSGCALQGLFRNPMADPWALGISNGAAFGASLAIIISAKFLGVVQIPLYAFACSMLTLFLLYSLGRRDGLMDVQSILLIGVSLSLFFYALVSMLQYTAGDELRAIIIWLMGSLTHATWKYVGIIFPMILLGCGIIAAFSRRLNLLSVDENTASSLGVNVERTKKIIMVACSMVIAAAVSFTGPIGFVGLIIPHVVRLLTGPDHRILIPSTFLSGAIFLICADTFARSMMNEIPVGIITAVFGCPFFIFLVRRRGKR